jgi:hypothetical protein
MHRLITSILGVAVCLALAACGSSDSSGPPTTTAAAPLDRIVFERSGGVAAPRVPDRIVVTDRADLDRLAALIPRAMPNGSPGGPTGCADCRSYRLTIVSGTTTHTSSFDEVSIPPPYRRLVAALSARL